jgi:hypothetical protein
MRLPRAVLVPRRGGLHPPALSPEPCSRSSGLRSCLPICIAPLATSRHRASLRRQAPRQRAYISSNKQVDVALESTCCKHLFRMFCLFILQCFIRMLYMSQWLFTYVASVLSGRCVWFAMVFKCFSGIFISVSDACFIYIQMYIASVAFGCFKSRSNIYLI